MENKRIVLPTKEYENAPQQDLNLTVNLESSNVLLREGEKDISLDVLQLFDAERYQSNEFKIYGKLKMIFRNMYSGDTGYNPLTYNLYLNGDGSQTTVEGYMPYNEFAFLRNDVLRELNVPQTGSTLGTYTQSIVATGTGYTGHTTITPITAPYQNWNFYLSYVYGQDSNYPMGFTTSGGTYCSFVSGDGIPFEVSSDNTYWILKSIAPHNMSVGEYINISGGTINRNNLTGSTFLINSIGNETFNSDKHIINILKSQFPSGTTLGNIVLGKRCKDIRNIQDSMSKYYVHKMKTLTDINGYIMDKLGFESPIWRDEKKIIFENSRGDNDVLVERNRMESVVFDFKEPFKLECIKNNMGYTPTDLYISVILRNGNGYFDYPPKVGYKFNFHSTWIDKYFNGNTSKESGLTGVTLNSNTPQSPYTFKAGTELPIGTILTGAFVEYNEYDFKETVISEAYHKFYNNPIVFSHGQTGDTVNFMGYDFSGATATNPFGYFYQPFYRKMLYQLSPYVETSPTNDVYNMPENARYVESTGLWEWRDLYDQGYIDPEGNGTNYPFINGSHYVHSDINFYLRNEASFGGAKQNGIIGFNNIKLDC